MDPERARNLEQPAQVGPYRIMDVLGAGGMGVVYRALDTKFNRLVAIKFLSEELADSVARRRFQREAQMASALNHPHILTVHDAGEFEGRQYLVTEFVDGGTLKDWAEAETRTWRQIVDLLVGVADGLAAAHSAGILHRDIKPTNILVAKNGYAKLADFGLAKLDEKTQQGDTTRTVTEKHTQPGVVIGTIAYMSPEQATGRSMDARSDVFSFGVVLYELLAGRRPFAGATDLETLQTIIHQQPLPLGNEIPYALRIAVEKALEKEPAERYQTMRDLVVDLRHVTRQKPEELTPEPPTTGPLHRRAWPLAAVIALTFVAGTAVGRWLWRQPATIERNVQFQRITDFVGMEDSPAISPDGKTVAFLAQAGGRRQIWIRLLAGGATVRLTNDDADHEQPRWAPDSSSLIYYSAPPGSPEQGAIWETSALGGVPRRIAAALSGGDVSHDGRRIAAFQLQGSSVALAEIARDGNGVRILKQFAFPYDHPRWSPDDRWIAFHNTMTDVFDEAIHVIPSAGGEPQVVAHSDKMQGMCWLPDGSGFVYSSSAGSTVVYPPIFNLRIIRKDGNGDRQLTFGDVSYVEPDVHASGKLLASRIRIQSDIWKFPFGGSPVENTRAGVRITRQTGQAQTPSASPDGRELVYLSDTGGHGNLWVSKTDGSGVRQITFERDPAAVLGVPIWSPAGDRIVFIFSRRGSTGEWLVNPDGSGLRQLVPQGSGAGWSDDGQWLYYGVLRQNDYCAEKVPADGGPPVRVQCGNHVAPAMISGNASTLYFMDTLRGLNGAWEILRAQPENGPYKVMGRIAASRIPVDVNLWQVVLSPDSKWFAAPLVDRGTTNLWAMPADGGPMRLVTDFGQRSIVIARRVSWSPDGKYIYAAVADTDADIVLLDGLLP